VSDTTLPDVTPLSCQRELSFTEFNRVISELMTRDRVLEEAVLAFTDEAYLQNTVKMLKALELIVGSDLLQTVISSGALPVNFADLATFEATTTAALLELQQATTVTDGENEPRSLKSVVDGLTNTMTAFSGLLTTFQAELDNIKAMTDQIGQVQTLLTSLDKRVTDLEALVGDLSAEITNARKEYASDPSKRLVDKIDAMDSVSRALTQKVNSLTKEVTDARSADRYDTLAQHIGAVESSVEALQDSLEILKGKGQVTGIRVGRSILHGDVELIPGSNIAITRERNGYRIDVADIGTVVDLSAPVIDPNNCCGPGRPSFGN
jgi:archaellum component FlaC